MVHAFDLLPISVVAHESSGFWEIQLGDLGEFLAAAVAVGIALAAVMRERRGTPKLSVNFDPAPSANDYLADTRVPGGGAHYVRMRIANAQGKRTAHGVEILLRSIKSSDGTPFNPGGYAFRWSNLSKDGDQPRTRMNVASGSERHFDLLCMVAPSESNSQGGFVPAPDGTVPATANLEIYPSPAGDLRALPAGSYMLELDIIADNCDAHKQGVRVVFDGFTCSSDGVRKHLNVALKAI